MDPGRPVCSLVTILTELSQFVITTNIITNTIIVYINLTVSTAIALGN